jgi:CRP-like cAMP-binding protein/predicted MFS family arabinose efflux permease
VTRPGGPSLFSSLKHRDYRLFIGAFTTSFIGSWAYSVALAVWLLDETGSAGWLAAATAARFAPALLTSAYGGVLADRVERIRLMVGLDLFFAASMVVLAGLMYLGAPPAAVLATVAVTATLSTVYEPAAAAMTPQLVPERDLGSANALRNTVDNVCVVAGPALGALVLVAADPWLAVLVNAATFVASAALIGRVRVRSTPVDVTDGGEAGALRQLTVGVRTMADSTTASVLVGFSVVATFVYGADTVLFVVVSDDLLGTGAEGYGYLLAGLGIGGVLAAGLVTRLERRPRLGPVILIGMAVFCLPTLVLLVSDSPAVAFAVQVVRGAGTLVVDVLAITALQRSVPADRLGRVFGAFDGLCLAAVLMGSALMPVGIDLLGLEAMIWFTGLGVPLLCLLGVPALRRMDTDSARRRTELAPRLALLSGSGLFASVSEGSLEQLAAVAEHRELAPGTVVVAQGDVADAFYLIESGELEVSSTDATGRPVALPMMSAGEGFGEIGLIEAIPRTATVRTATDAALLRIPGEAFVSALTQETPPTALLDGASLRLRRTHPARQLTQAGLAQDG